MASAKCTACGGTGRIEQADRQCALCGGKGSYESAVETFYLAAVEELEQRKEMDGYLPGEFKRGAIAMRRYLTVLIVIGMLFSVGSAQRSQRYQACAYAEAINQNNAESRAMEAARVKAATECLNGVYTSIYVEISECDWWHCWATACARCAQY